MKVAANIIAVLAWGSLLAAQWVVMVTDFEPPGIRLLGVLFLSFVVGVVVPSYLLNLENRHGATEPPGERRR